MPVSVEVPTLVAGVSQQPPKTRRPGKVESADNVWLSPALGAARRPSSHSVAQTHTGSTPPERKFVAVDLNGEVYFALLREEEVLVYDSAGTAVPVRSPNGNAGLDLRPLDRQPYGVNYMESVEDIAAFWVVAAGTVSAGLGTLSSPEVVGPFTVAADTHVLSLLTDGGGGSSVTLSRTLTPRPATRPGHRVEFFVHQSLILGDVDDFVFSMELRDVNDVADLISASFDWSGAAWSVNAADPEITASVLDVGGGWWRLRMDVEPNTTYSELSAYSINVQTTPAADRELLVWGPRDSEMTPSVAALAPQSDLRALTVQDFTFVLNRTTRTALRSDLSEERLVSSFYVGDDPAFVGVRAFSETDFTVRWQTSADAAAQEFTHTTGAGAPNSENTCGALATGINAAAATTISALAVGSTLLLDPGAGETFTLLEVRDSQANTLLALVWHEVDSITDLPLSGPDGFVVRITGSPGSALDDHYVVFRRASDASDVTEALEAGEGLWEETVAPGVQLGLDGLTMPFQLVRRFDDAFGAFTGTPFGVYFEWGPVAWVDRAVGDDETNPAPSFVGEFLTDVAFHRNRLALSAVESVVLSESAVYFNAWRTTTTALPDSDPVDVAASHTERSDIRHVLSLDEALLMVSDETVFTLTSGNGPLTPAAATVKPVLKLASDRLAAPAAFQASVILAGLAGPNASLHSVFRRDVDLWDSAELTQEVPSYLSEAVREVVSAPRAGLLLVRTDTLLRLWFNSRDGEGQPIQAAWASWDLAVDRLAGVGVVDADLWLLADVDDQQLLLRLPLDPTTTEAGETWSLHLDARCTPIAVVYDLVEDETTFTLPRDVLATDMVVELATGDQFEVVSRTGDEIVVEGDHTVEAVTVGTPVDSSLVLTAPYPKLPSQLGGLSARRGRFQASFCAVDVEDTHHVRMTISSTGRADRTADFTAPESLGEVTLADGELRALVASSPDDALRVELHSVGPLPFRLVGAAWSGEWWSGLGAFGSA